MTPYNRNDEVVLWYQDSLTRTSDVLNTLRLNDTFTMVKSGDVEPNMKVTNGLRFVCLVCVCMCVCNVLRPNNK